MSTISLTVPVQSLMINAQSVTSALSATDNGTNDTMSFADCLKESNDDSDKENQTAATPRSHTSPKRATATKEPHLKASDGASGSLVIGDIAQPQVLDPRSLMLSWKKSAAEKGKQVQSVENAAGQATASQANSASPSATAAVSKAPIAFTVSIPKDGAKAPNSQGAAVNGNAVAAVGAPKNAQAETDSDASTGGGHSDSKDSGDAQPASLAGASGLGPAKDHASAAATVTPLAANTNINTNIVQAVPAAYTVVDTTKTSSNSVAAASPVTSIEEPVTMPTVKPQSIEIRVPGAGDNQVDVRVSQRAGNVDVTVRTPDNELAQSLRQHLPELSESLSQGGVSGEILQPAASAETSNGNNSHTQEDTSQGWQDQQQSQQQQAQQQSDSQQNRRRSNWMEQLYTE